jgi:hypothetical protein
MKFALSTHTVTDFEEDEATTLTPPPTVIPAKTPTRSTTPGDRSENSFCLIAVTLLI